MMLKSVKEDLQARTLRAISGLLGKLDYFASLRQKDGSYHHWGLARVHGEAAAQTALADAHRSLVSVILRTPLRKLVEDLEESREPKSVSQAEFLKDLQTHESEVLPLDPAAGYRRHLSSMLQALSALTKIRG
jgi:hypothetical protein